MTNKDLEQTLDSLHQSLVDTPQIDEQTASKMRSLIDEIQLVLARSVTSTETPPSNQTLTERVQELMADFGVHHPQLTSNLSYIAERLADMGI